MAKDYVLVHIPASIVKRDNRIGYCITWPNHFDIVWENGDELRNITDLKAHDIYYEHELN